MPDAVNIPFELVQEFKTILGAGAVLTHPAELKLYSCDGLRLHSALPGCVVLPESTDDVAHVVRACSTYNFPFAARGAGTGLSGGALSRGGVIIQLSRMNQVLELNPNERYAVVQPGVINSFLTQTADKYNLHFAPDPSSQIVATIGGNVAENAGGPHTLKYGVTTDHVLGQTVVIASGEILELGGRSRFQPGYDLSSLLSGSEGTLGITTEIIVNLTLNPGRIKTYLLIFDKLYRATDCVSAIIEAGIIPTAMEMMEKLAIQAVEKKLKPGFPETAEAILIVELDDLNCDIDLDVKKLKSIVTPFISTPLQEAKNAAERERLWRGRKHAAGSLGQLAPAYYTNDGVVPRDKLTEVFIEIQKIADKFKVPIASFCHAGDGNIHPNVLYDPKDPQQIKTAQEASLAILEVCVRLGGTITGEHGVGLEKRDVLGLKHAPHEIQLMQDLKAVFDPKGLVNPEKIFPLKAGCGEFSAPGKKVD